jgi:hypothetical protein
MAAGYSGLRKMGIEVNSKGSQEWVYMVGAFMVNNGHAEISTYKWLTWIGGEDFENAKGQNFEFRMGLIYGFVAAHVKDDLEKATIRKYLGKMRQIYSLRNVIAHNPVAMKLLPDGTWQIVIPNIKDMSNSPVVPALLKEDFARNIDEMMQCIIALEGIFIGVMRDRDGVEPNV